MKYILNLSYFLNYVKDVRYLIINFLKEINIVFFELRNILEII